MAEGKLDRTLDLSSDESLRTKVSLSVGLDEEKAALGFVDEFKDQQSSENIPLSPQWLYAKPTEIKDGRPQNLPEVPQENRRERRRSTLETENSQSTRRWREEERETGLLGRRGDRPKKESDPPARNPNPSNSIKWSSRWGPDDHRERVDKKPVDVTEKEQNESNPNPNSNPSTEKFASRPLSEADSRDKWRPRHRQEGPVATYRAAPGFGSERGGGGARQEPIANVGFAPGRGRSSSSLGRAGPIGASPFCRGGSGDKVGRIMFRYPRGRLLDIYRKNRLVAGNNDNTLVGFEAVPSVTLPSEVSPLAFLAPDNEETVTLEDIYKGKLTSSDTDSHNADPLKKTDSSRIESGFVALGEEKYTLPTTVGISSPELDANRHDLNIGLIEDPFSEFTEKPKMLKTEVKDMSCFESSVNLPDDLSSPFDEPFIHDKPENLEKSPSLSLEEVSLYYQDPHGGIQGPFLGIDIISWFQEGYFGLDLPVCPTDAPEGTLYRPLGELFPQLREKLQPVEIPGPVPVVSNSEADVANPLGGTSEYNNDKSATDGFEGPLEGGIVGWVPEPNQVDPGAASRFEEQWLQGASVGLDNEEVIYAGRPKSGMGTSQAIKQTSEITDLPLWATSDEPPYNATSEMGDSSQTHRSATLSNDNINPLGLLWSELESSQSKHPLSSNLPPNYRKSDSLKDPSLPSQMQHTELKMSHLTLEEKLLSEQLQHQQLQQLQQEQLFARTHGGRSQSSDLEHLFKFQYEMEQQRKLQLQQERLQQERLQQERLQQERLQHERLQQERLLQERLRREQMMIRQQQMQEQLLLEQMLQQQLQQERLQQERLQQERLQEQQMLREQQFLNELQRAQHIQRQQQDAAIEQLIQAKFGPAGQRQIISPSIEQQLLLGLQQRDPIQAQQLAIALRQQEQQRLEEEMMLRGVRPTGPSGHHGPGLRRTSSSRLSQLERSLSLHEQLQSMERSISINAGPTAPSPRNVEFAQTLAQLELQERQLQERQSRERQLQERERQQRAMFGSHGGSVDQFWQDLNSNPVAAQLERSLIESHLNHQLQLEAESQMRVRKPGSGLEDAHLWGPQEGLTDAMYHQNMPLQSPHGSYKDSSLLFNSNPSPNTNSGINIEAMQSGVRPGSSSGPGSFVDKQDLFGNRGDFQNEGMGNPNPNSMGSSDMPFFDSFGEAVTKTDQEPVRAPTPARHSSFGSSDDANFIMGEDATAFGEELVDSRPRVMVRTDSRIGGSLKNSEADQQHQAVPRPPSRPTSADAARQEARGGIHRSETQTSSKKEIRLLRAPSSSGGESDASGPTFMEMLKSTKKPPQPASQLDDLSDAGPGGKGAKKKGKKGRQIDPSLLGFKVHSNRIMMGEIQRPDES